MARLKKDLLAIFSGCQSNTDIFKAMMKAKKAGYTTEEVSAATAKAKKDIMSQPTEYKRLYVKSVTINYFQQFHVGYPVTVKNINSKTVVLSKEGVVI
ncbi:hypothetical protein [Bacteroides acidifaciens]|uniref:hypothetical protein n=1 Tax=Bacteroides acidifaciens TaxID=85831 RepID=UPI0025A9B13A|nr:hypothetical protein [Bacteroides acidifaciens]